MIEAVTKSIFGLPDGAGRIQRTQTAQGRLISTAVKTLELDVSDVLQVSSATSLLAPAGPEIVTAAILLLVTMVISKQIYLALPGPSIQVFCSCSMAASQSSRAVK